MRGSLRVAAVSALVAMAAAGCPNGCSGNGICSQNDLCTCFRQWTGPDCSLRMCLFGAAWANDAADPHSLAECSNQGLCNRVTGECECFPGFEGRACTRMSCPNKCSGNGVCKALKDLNTTVPYSVNNWDANRIMGCQCDPGYFGHDCSQRYCPTGDDPLTLCATTYRNHVQEIKFVLGSKVKHVFLSSGLNDAPASYDQDTEEMDLFGSSKATYGGTVYGFSSVRAETWQMRVAYTDAFGAKYVAHGVDGVMQDSTSKTSRDSLETALETLPGNKVRDVLINSRLDTSIHSSVFTRRYLVTFVADNTNSINVGLQRPLSVDSGFTCTEAGCSPMIRMPFLHRYAAVADADTALGYSVTAGATNIEITSLTPPAGRFIFRTADMNSDDHFASGRLLRLHPDSQPQMPTGIAVDTSVSATLLSRYDMRILVAVMDPSGDASDTAVDVYYTRVIIGHDNIMSDSERVGFAAPYNGVWGKDAGGVNYKPFTTTLNGFTFQGKIPSNYQKVAVAGAPGAYISFPGRNIVKTDSYGRWYEIVIKLPHATVTPVMKANQLQDFSSNWIAPVDDNVENMECSGRGTCDRSLGTCMCYKGYTGNSCHMQSAIV